MFGYGISQSKKLFLDTRKIKSSALRGQITAMTKAGALCRRIARQSMKEAGKVPRKDLIQLALSRGVEPRGMNRQQISDLLASSEAGLHAPAGHPPFSHVGLLKKFLFYVFDRSSFSVVTGPARLGGKLGKAPSVLESGGYVYHSILRRPVRIKARPYMKPALDKTIPKFPKMFADCIKP